MFQLLFAILLFQDIKIYRINYFIIFKQFSNCNKRNHNSNNKKNSKSKSFLQHFLKLVKMISKDFILKILINLF